jgi:hypothetical protein
MISCTYGHRSITCSYRLPISDLDIQFSESQESSDSDITNHTDTVRLSSRVADRQTQKMTLRATEVHHVAKQIHSILGQILVLDEAPVDDPT